MYEYLCVRDPRSHGRADFMDENETGPSVGGADEGGEASQVDTVERFAADLRLLRLAADSPTYQRLQSDTGISRSVLSEAFGGRQLPSARTVDRIVRACNGVPAEWAERRDALARSRSGEGLPLAPDDEAAAFDTPEVGSGGADLPSKDPIPPVDRSRSAKVRRTTAILLATVAGIAGVALGAGGTYLFADAVRADAADGPAGSIEVQNGQDPIDTACLEDAKVITGDTRADNSLLEVIYSVKCGAGWGRITRYDGLSFGNTVTIAIYPQTSPDGPDRQEATEHDVQSAYTFLVKRPSPETRLCAEGSFTVDGKRIDLGDPLCA